jgi:undecaprenyl-diphosphatase
MNSLIIFAAKYLFALSILIYLWLCYREYIAGTWKKFAVFSLSVLGLSYILGLLARIFYFNPRPFVVGGYEPLIPHIVDNGFPSDHLLLLSALAASAGFVDRKLAALMWFIAFIVGMARVWAGVHHTLDIVGSILIALIAKWVVYFVLNTREKV